MKEIRFQVLYGNKSIKVKISNVSGGGGDLIHLYVDNYWHGSLKEREKVWELLSNVPTEFTFDDIQGLGEMIENRSNEYGINFSFKK
jgi:hypothetical protein